jgi:hypothetical protein
MIRLKDSPPAGGSAIFLALLILLCGASMSSCKATRAAVASADRAEVGRMMEAEGWEVTLIGLSEKVQIVGWGEITYRADGVYIIVPLKVQNKGAEMRLLPQSQIQLRDAEGRQFRPTLSAIQVAYALPRDMELLLDSPFAAGADRESILIFDVPLGATDLQLALKGIDETLDLGF